MEKMGPFLVATVALLVVPGPSVVFAVTRALSLGRAAGLVSVVGLEAGLFVHVAAATVGLSALAASSKVTMTGLRLAGAAYLLFLAGRIALAHPAPVGAGVARPVPTGGAGVDTSAGRPRLARWALVRDAFLVDLLNPQSLLFFMAFLPQFVDVRHGATIGQLFVLGLCVLVLAFACDGAYVLVCTALVGRRSGVQRGWGGPTSRRAAGVTSSVYVALAVWAAIP